MQIDIEAPEQYGALTWPDSTIPSMLPMPTSVNGEIVQDSETGFQANIGNTSIDDFKEYVTACADAGFNIDSYESDESYSAENSEGYKLSLSYQWNKVMAISVDEPEYEVSFEIECVENWLFSKYNVDVYLDDMLEGTIEHGTTKTFDVILTKGTYEIKFANEENGDVTGSVEIDIHRDETLKYKISCASDKIDVETIVGTISEYGEDEAPIPQSASSYKFGNYKDAQKELTDAGFTNISYEILYDIVLGWTDEGEIESISVDGNTDFEKNDIFKKDAPIVITYHMKEDDDPNKPVENEDKDSDEGESETPTQKPEEPEETKETEETEESEESVLITTIENDADFAALMQITDQTDATTIKQFTNSHIGTVIEFDGCIAFMMKHKDYNTRFDVAMVGGDYYADRVHGPFFSFENVNFGQMNVSGTDTVAQGMNFRIVGEIKGFNDDGCYIILDPVSLDVR